MTYVRMADAAYAQNIPPGFDIAAGYYGGPDEYRQWPAADWGRFPGDIYGARLDLGPRAAAVLERYEQRRQERWALA